MESGKTSIFAENTSVKDGPKGGRTVKVRKEVNYRDALYLEIIKMARLRFLAYTIDKAPVIG